MYRLRVLGGFALEGLSGAPAPPRPQRRGDAVLAVLAVCGDRACARERLLTLLWPECDDARARQGLRDALYAIRRSLGPAAVPSEGRTLRLAPLVVTSDVRAFAEGLARGQHAEAVHVYAGPLLDGFHVDEAPEFERWLDGERTRLAREYAEALEQLATDAEDAGAWHEALRWWGRAVEHDPLNSHSVFQQLRAMAAIGDRANAIKAADAHARRLREEFELEIDPDFLLDVERIRRGALPARRGAAPRRPDAPADRPVPAERARGGDPDSGIPAAAPATAAVARRRPWLRWAAGIAALAALGGGWEAARGLKSDGAAAAPRTSVAVLPFRYLGADSTQAYLAGGLHDELLAQLAKVASLVVVGRASVSGYGETPKPLRRIGAELGVGSVVEASVQVAGPRLRVVVQLLDPATGAALWADRYDRGLDSAFAVQSDIARQIVAAVGGTLTSGELGAIAAAPTVNARAYAFFLQGTEYWRRPGAVRRNLESAQQLFARAVALDSTFAIAHAALSCVHAANYRMRYDHTAARLAAADREAAIALRLAPDLPRAHFAAGLAREAAGGDSRGALREFGAALRRAPNDPELWAWIGRAYRHLGEWDSAMVAFARARRLDPRDASLFIGIGEVLHYFHRYPEAIAAYRQAMELAPDLVEPHLSLAWSYVLWRGQTDTLSAVLRDLPLDGDPGGGATPVLGQRLSLLYWERRPDSMLALLQATAPGIGTLPELGRAWPTAMAHALRGDSAAARSGFEFAAARLDLAVHAHPEDADAHASRGIALARLGRRADALREAEWLDRLKVDRDDHWDSSPAQGRARILVQVGETDAAIAAIERLLAHPSRLGVGELLLSPDFDPIRGDPRFEALLARYSGPAGS